MPRTPCWFILSASARLGRKLTDGISDDIQDSNDGWGKQSIDSIASDDSVERFKKARKKRLQIATAASLARNAEL
jgi:hypothetical protein